MSFQKTASVLGSPILYRLNPSAKRYTLKDNGFKVTKGGNYQLIMPLKATPQSQEGFRLKVTVDKDIKQLKMSITTKNGLKAVNIFEDERYAMLQEKFFFLLRGMMDRGLFEEVKEEQ